MLWVSTRRIEMNPIKIVYPNEAVDEVIGGLDASKVLKLQRLKIAAAILPFQSGDPLNALPPCLVSPVPLHRA
jgi:hypothetical protein